MTQTAAAAAAAPARLLAIGDSITHGDGSTDGTGFRDDLYELLIAADVDVLMIGSNGESPYRGHFSGGKRIRQFYPRTYGNGWGTGTVDVTGDVSVLLPRVALIHLGTNDINSYHTPFTPYSDNGGRTLIHSAAGRMAEFVSYLLQWSDGTRGDHLESIILSRIVPIRYRDADVSAFNAEISAMVEDFVEGSITGRPERVLIADPWSRFNANPRLFDSGTGGWMADDLHPNDGGYAEMAELYAEQVRAALEDFTPPAPVELAVGDRGGRSLSLVWTAPGGDGHVGRAQRYDLRFSTAPIDERTFRDATRVLSEPDPAPAGTSQSLRIGSLQRDRTYYLACRAIDGAANRSALAVLTVRTTDDSGYATDAFERDSIGEAWARSPSVSIADGAARAAGGDPDLAHLMVYAPEEMAGSVEIVLGKETTVAGVSQVGVALRLDRPNLQANGYAVVRDGEAPGGCRLLHLSGGRAVAEIDEATGTAPHPGPGDRIGVVIDEGGGAFLFRVYVNGVLDAELRDPGRRVNGSRRHGGFVLTGGAPVAVDRVNLLRPAARAAPEPVALMEPADGAAAALEPRLVWTPALDPNVGETVRYAVQIDTSPSMAGPDSVTGLLGTAHSIGRALDPLTTYYWRVRAYDPTGRGSMSAIHSFVTVSGAAGIDDPEPGAPRAARLHAAVPNPFNPRTTIRYTLAAPGPVRLAIHDVRGRLVRTLVEGVRQPGEHAARWDGVSEAGRSAASGVYLVRLDAAGRRWTRKVTLAR